MEAGASGLGSLNRSSSVGSEAGPGLGGLLGSAVPR